MTFVITEMKYGVGWQWVDITHLTSQFRNRYLITIPPLIDWNALIDSDPTPNKVKEIMLKVVDANGNVYWHKLSEYTVGSFDPCQKDIKLPPVVYAASKYFLEFTDTLGLIPNGVIRSVAFMRESPLQHGDNSKNVFVFNTEQLSLPYWRKLMIYTAKTRRVIDYSRANTRFAKNEDPSYQASCLPIVYQKKFLLPPGDSLIQRQYDVTILGNATADRLQIISELRSQGISVNLVNNVFDYRLKMIEVMKARILLNLHKDNENQVFEFARCSTAVFNSQIILSVDTMYKEEETGTNALVQSYVHFTKLEELIPTLRKMLADINAYAYQADLERFEKVAQTDVTDFISSITE